jgi:Bacterial Ig-like domain (group 3)/Autotransporter beta-domain
VGFKKRICLFGAVLMAVALASVGQARALSAGCTAFTGNFQSNNFGYHGVRSTNLGFNAGEKITVTVNSIGNANNSYFLADTTTGAILISQTTSSASYTFPANTSDTITMTVNNMSGGGLDISWSCGPGLASTSTTVTSSPNPSVFGRSVTFTTTVTASSGGGTPTGTVTFLDGGSSIGTATLSGGVATFTTSALAAGNHTITASYGGDSSFMGSNGSLTAQVVNKADTSTTITSSQNPSEFGQAVTFTATVSAVAPGAGTPSGTVTFLDGGSSIGTGTLSGGVATITTSALASGNHTITASYTGNGNFNGSAFGILQLVNTGNTTTAVTSSQNSSVFGQGVTFTATVSVVPPESGTPTGTVTFKDGATVLGTGTLNGSGQAQFSISTLAAGGHSITATYAGDTKFAGSTSPVLTQSVGQGGTTTTIVSSVNPSTFGQPVIFTATVNGSGGNPTGPVTFKDGANVIGTGTLNGNGQATLATSSLSAGNHAITAVYGGDSTFSGSTSPVLSQVVNMAATTTTLASSANPVEARKPVTFTATVTSSSGTPTGTVLFKDGGVVIGSGTLAGGVATFTTSSLALGTHTITATYTGSGNFGISTSAPLLQTVQIPLDSVRLRALQIAVTNLEAQASGAAFAGAVDDAIGDGFAEGGGTLISPRGNGVRINFGADDDGATRRNPRVASQYDAVTATRMFAFRDSALSNIDQNAGLPPSVRSFAPDQSMLSNRVDDSFTALGYANPMVTKSPPLVVAAPKVWQLWADVRGTGWSTDQSVGDIHGGQINALAGLTRKVTPNFLIGVLGGYENFSYDSQLLNGRLKGDGWTVGGYLGWRLLPGLRFDASVGRSGINYDGVSGTASGAFLGSRWLATTALIGTYKTYYGVEIEPSAKVYALWEHENSYTDSLGTLQADRNFSSGRASTGVKVAYPWLLWWAAMKVTPYAGVYADYYFNRDDNVPLSASAAPILLPTQFVHGWSARLTSGVDMTLVGGTRLSVGGEVGGLGNDFTVWSVRGRAAVPF